MHVFIDTNILLKFFHFTEVELDALTDVFASHEHGSAEVHLTEQVRCEFVRNRETKIKDALKKFTDVKLAPQLPSFLKGYPEYQEIRELARELQGKRRAILEKVSSDVARNQLLADRLITEIFDNTHTASISDEVFGRASRRVALGNPPGKPGSLGDAVNWELLIESLDQGEDIHIISEDGDFYSALDEEKGHAFLAEEWRSKKEGALYVYRTLSAFMGEHFDGVAFSFDKEKEALINELAAAGSFATTHGVIAKLEDYTYYSAREVARILDAALQNDQFGGIIGDRDIQDFLARIALPYKGSISGSGRLEVLEGVEERASE